MITIKVTDNQAKILNTCIKNYIEFLDTQIGAIEDESIVKYAKDRKADCVVITKVTSKAINDWEQRPREALASDI